MAARLVGFPDWRFLLDDGSVNAGGTLDFHEPGTSTDKSIWKDAAKATEHDNPLTLDSAGRPPNPVFAEGLYDVVVKDSDGTTLVTISNWGDNFSSNSEQSPNLVCNYSFEDDDNADDFPDEWSQASGTASSRVTDTQSHGAASLKFTSVSSSSDVVDSCFIPVSPNLNYLLSFEYKASNGSATPKVDIDFYNAAQSSTSTTKVWDPGSSQTSWTLVGNLSFTPPAGSFWAKISIDGNQAVTAYTTWFDNFFLSAQTDLVAPQKPSGMLLSRDAGDTSHDINITAGKVRSHDDTYNIIHPVEMTKRMDATHADGDDAGGMESGTSLGVDDMYAVWAIADSTKGKVDYLGSASFTSPTMPTGYDKKNLIGVFWTDASANIYDFIHYDNFFRLLGDIIEDVNDTTITSVTFETATLRCPPNCIAQIYVYAENTSTLDDDMVVWLRPKGANDSASSANAQESYIGIDNDTATINHVSVAGEIYVNDDSQMEYATQEAAGVMGVNIRIRGCKMLTRGQPNV